jgi:anti-sigma-K factor RskA
MVTSGHGEVATMSKSLARYQNTDIIEHLASQHALGLLSNKTSKRLEQLLINNPALEQRLYYWQARFNRLDQQSKELMPNSQTWSNIEQQINPQQQQATTENQLKTSPQPSPFRWSFSQLANVFLLIVIALLSYLLMKKS